MAYLNEPTTNIVWLTPVDIYKSGGGDDPDSPPPVYYVELDDVYVNFEVNIVDDDGEDATYSGDPIKFIALPDTATEILPKRLTLDEDTGVLSGNLQDMDLYIPQYIAEQPAMPVDGSIYGTYGSALHGTATARFTIRVISSIGYADRTFEMPVENTYSSDRDQFLRLYSGTYENDQGTFFMINGTQVDVETYIQHWKDLGIFI